MLTAAETPLMSDECATACMHSEDLSVEFTRFGFGLSRILVIGNFSDCYLIVDDAALQHEFVGGRRGPCSKA